MKRNSILLTIAVVTLLLTVLWSAQQQAQPVNADAITNYEGRITIDAGTTAHTADWNSTAWSTAGYGSVYIQVTQDITDAADSVVYTLYRSIDPVGCASVTNWEVAYDVIYVSNPAVAAGRYISYTQNVTGTSAITDTYVYTTVYHYADVAAVSASVSTVSVTQTATLLGDKTHGIKLDTGGAWCMRIAADITTGRTVTTTIYAAPTDIYE